MGAYLRRLAPRAWRVLWGPVSRFFTGSATVLTLIGIFERPLLGSISDTWEVVPWWFGLVALIPLLFYAFVRASYQEYRAATAPRAANGTVAPQQDREREQLERRLQKAEQENKRLRAFLADPKAKEQREEEALRKRCGEVALDTRAFARAHSARYTGYADRDEAVERFRLRHYGRVEDAREELDKRGWLTDQERDDLTLNARDGLQKIERMANVLGNIAVKR